MQVPVGQELATDRGIANIRIDETVSIDFYLSDKKDQYIDLGPISGNIVVDYQINRGGLMKGINRIDNPNITDRINMFLENWSLDDALDTEIELNYGTLLLKGVNPMDIDSTYDLGDSFSRSQLQSLSPEDLRRELRTEEAYETTYEDIEAEISHQLKREGITETVDISAPIRLQARANPRVEGTDFTITVENTQPHKIIDGKIKIEMPPSIGREVHTGHTEEEINTSGLQGSYDPEQGTYIIEINEIPESTTEDITKIPFYVSKTAPESLDRLGGRAEFVRNIPFSDVRPVGIFDSGGHPIEDQEFADINTRGKIMATFETPVSEITIDQQGDLTKKIRVEGVPPDGEVINRIEERIQERGVTGYEQSEITQSRNMREGSEVTHFQTSFTNGRVRYRDAEIEITVKVDGERRTAQRESTRETDENLPAERRSVTTETGYTGVVITGDGIETEIVDEYVSELRDDLKMTLSSLSEAF